MSTFNCVECFDTKTIDFGGAEIPCPYCKVKPQDVLLRGLAHGLGYQGSHYNTAAQFSSSTLTFRGTKAEILADVRRVRQSQQVKAREMGYKGRNSISSWAIAIEKKVQEALSCS